MCRSDTHHFGSHPPDPLLTTNAFYLSLKLSASAFNNRFNNPLSDSLTLLYLPRINGCPLEVNGSRIRPETPTYITLHRVVKAAAPGSVVFGSQDRVQVSGGAKFEVYNGEEKLLKGVFSRGKGSEWRVDCTCVLEREIHGLSVAEAEVCVAVEGGRMRTRVAAAEKRRRRRRCGGFDGLEEIPEEAGDEEEEASFYCGCCCDSGSDGGEYSEEEDLTAVEEAELEYEMEGVRWAVDVGIWVVCLGVGYLVSRASAKTFRKRKTLL